MPHDVIDAVANHHRETTPTDELDVGVAVRIALGLAAELAPELHLLAGSSHEQPFPDIGRLGGTVVVDRLRAAGRPAQH